jgi:hypothetical protein
MPAPPSPALGRVSARVAPQPRAQATPTRTLSAPRRSTSRPPSSTAPPRTSGASAPPRTHPSHPSCLSTGCPARTGATPARLPAPLPPPPPGALAGDARHLAFAPAADHGDPMQMRLRVEACADVSSAGGRAGLRLAFDGRRYLLSLADLRALVVPQHILGERAVAAFLSFPCPRQEGGGGQGSPASPLPLQRHAQQASGPPPDSLRPCSRRAAATVDGAARAARRRRSAAGARRRRQPHALPHADLPARLPVHLSGRLESGGQARLPGLRPEGLGAAAWRAWGFDTSANVSAPAPMAALHKTTRAVHAVHRITTRARWRSWRRCWQSRGGTRPRACRPAAKDRRAACPAARSSATSAGCTPRERW